MIVTGVLENWVVDPRGIIWGHIYNDIHERFRDGTWIHTSLIVQKDSKTRMPEEDLKTLKEGDRVQTLNSFYRLGKKSV